MLKLTQSNLVFQAPSLFSLALAFGITECVDRDVAQADKHNAEFMRGYEHGTAKYHAKLVAAQDALKAAGIQVTLADLSMAKFYPREQVAIAGETDCSAKMPNAWYDE